MIYIPLQDGTRVPALGFGTWQLKGDTAREAVEHALHIGYRHLDTAQDYDNEEEVGAGLRASGVPRDEVWLTTKAWPQYLLADGGRTAVDESLRRLGTDYVDLFLIHWPNPEVDHREALETLRTAREAGKVRYVGVSNFTPTLVREALQVVPDLITDQVEYHPYLGQQKLLEVLREHGMFLTAYSPLGRGNAFEEETVRAITEAHEKTPAQVVLRWHLQQDRVAAIPKAASPEHREANFDIFDFGLSEEEMARIHGLARRERLIDPDFAPDWER